MCPLSNRTLQLPGFAAADDQVQDQPGVAGVDDQVQDQPGIAAADDQVQDQPGLLLLMIKSRTSQACCC